MKVSAASERVAQYESNFPYREISRNAPCSRTGVPCTLKGITVGETMRAALFGASIIALLAADNAHAQQDSSLPPATNEQASATDGEPIIVPGSRIVRNGFEAPTPVTVMGSEHN